ncbi:asparagine synthase (glutamine-hydrolyzing) [Marinobacter sp. CHS3-4]|uniref:asparagine synthase (glutamine-hydrolyzing) n=1 Tax=Marinobacter sp. CHS3-4 TaxID=3045174 RepID=UPI0024B4FF9A|nr:asparagine synthase (glutamine-hydrolyzing) [Marinobacter sp. CHS3-4]MDI9244997.1 asparagine synthase (glutamine-hydrolyzing) [Marinobacter sp. CHS3-4]
MCGLCGVLVPHNVEIGREVISKMTDTLRRRGPDAQGIHVERGIGLGHQRLSIQDLSDAGAQPMVLRPRGPVIAFNGEVYNFLELKRELSSQKGFVFRGHSDTEVILHVYDAWGLEGLRRLEGIFAFALWDPIRRRLILMRDRLGVKPLFYANSIHGLAFGSEIKALLAAGGVDTSLNEQAFAEYLWYGNAYEERSLYRGIQAIQPGHWMIIEDGEQRLEPWWRIEDWLERTPTADTPQEAAVRVREALDASVKRQLVADVPVGLFLSGGIDSSAIAASAMNVQSRPLSSYSVGFDFEEGVNELPRARQVAEHFGLDHHEMRVEGANLPETLMTLARAHDEPFADAANIPLYLLCQQLGDDMKVVMQGDGGDEMFGGYRRYAILRNTHWWRLWPKMLSSLLRNGGESGRRLARIAEATGNCDAALRMGLLLTVETLNDPPEALLEHGRRAALSSSTDPFLAYRNAAKRFAAHEPVQQMLLTDISVQLPSQFLTKVDRATMAGGVEARVPLLDERIAELAVGIPSSWKTRGMEKKIVLRNSQRGRVPDFILDSPKTGFGVPYEHWLRESLHDFSRDMILNTRFLQRFGFDRSSVERAFKEHRSQRRERGFLLWKLLQLALWAEKDE